MALTADQFDALRTWISTRTRILSDMAGSGSDKPFIRARQAELRMADDTARYALVTDADEYLQSLKADDDGES